MGKGNYLSKVLAQGEAVWGALRLVQDNWQNVFTGLGTSRDKTMYGRFVSLSELPETELTSLYHQNDTTRKIVALKPHEMMRQGFDINIEDDVDASSATMQALRELHASKKIRDAMIWGRLYGGAAVIVGADDGMPADTPLEESRVKAIRFLHVVDKRHLVPDTYFDDPMNDEFFGLPQTYRVTPRRGATNMVVHRSRMLLFGGAHTSDEERDRLGGWDHSVINAVYQVLRQFDNVWAAAEHLMSDASQGVFKIQGLMSMIAGGQKDVLQTRMQLVDMSRSVARALLLDADGGEEFMRQNSSFTDAQNMLEKFMMRLASATDIPVTILMGRSPAGMNATGDADFRWFYDTIRTAQENELKPELSKLVRILFLSKEGPTKGVEPDTWEVKFKPLWQPTPNEEADLRKTQAEIDKIYATDIGAVLPEEIALSRFRAEGFSHDTQIDRELRESVLETEKTLPTEEPIDTPPTPEPVDAPPTAGAAADLGFSPTDTATFTTVNEARRSKGLPDWPDVEEGKLTVAAFKALKESEATKVGEAEGDAAADEIKPEPDTPPPTPPTPPGAPEPVTPDDEPMPPPQPPDDAPPDEEA